MRFEMHDASATRLSLSPLSRADQRRRSAGPGLTYSPLMLAAATSPAGSPGPDLALVGVAVGLLLLLVVLALVIVSLIAQRLRRHHADITRPTPPTALDSAWVEAGRRVRPLDTPPADPLSEQS